MRSFVSLCLLLPALLAASIGVAIAAAQNSSGKAAEPNPAMTPTPTGAEAARSVIAGLSQFFRTILEMIYLIVGSVWDIALWIADRMIRFLGQAVVNPFSGDHLISSGALGSSRWATPVLALTLLGVVGLSLAGPLYLSWKMWRMRNENRLRYR